MANTPELRQAVWVAREQLAAGREQLKEQHDRGLSGTQLCNRLSDLWDQLILGLHHSVLQDAERQDLPARTALVAHGGYGRRDVAPYSDVDLMLLTSAAAHGPASDVARYLTRDLCDAGLQLGFSLRTPSEACFLAMKDVTIFTSLIESRLLWGSEQLFQDFIQRYEAAARRRWRSLVPAIVESRRRERQKFGETSYLLEPNIKRTRGGLRDVQLVRWVGFTRYGASDLGKLGELDALKTVDRERLADAHQFLLTLRNELHFHAGKSQDRMSREEQVRIAGLHPCQPTDRLVAVERFMRDFFQRTSDVRDISTGFIDGIQARSGVLATIALLFAQRVEDEFRVGPVHVSATRKGLDKMRHDLSEVLRLMDLANIYQKRIDHHTWETVRLQMANHPPRQVPEKAIGRFLSLMSRPGRLGNLLRRLHQLRVLEQIIPAMQHARYLMEFNDYHKYTVDEHSIRAVEAATSFLSDSRAIGEAYRDARDKRTLHIALLIHDLGKGYDRDHSDVGTSIAADVAQRLRLSEDEAEGLRFLVKNHLLMPHMAFREDLQEESVILRLARKVGSVDLLQLLYVLSAADLAAVGPNMLSDWKLELLTELYLRTRSHLTGEEASQTAAREADRRRERVHKLVAAPSQDPWWQEQIAALPNSYLLNDSPERIDQILTKLRKLGDSDAVAWSTYSGQLKVTSYLVGTYESITPGIFHKLAGALTGKGLQILSAEIHTLANDLVLDRFYVEDNDFTGMPPDHRTQDVCEALVRALTSDADKRPAFRSLWTPHQGSTAADYAEMPTQIRFDDASSEQFTIITIFTYDRRGLLYSIARTLFELRLEVRVAKIGTYLDQVVDVFYVTDAQQRKIYNQEKRNEIRKRLEEALAADN